MKLHMLVEICQKNDPLGFYRLDLDKVEYLLPSNKGGKPFLLHDTFQLLAANNKLREKAVKFKRLNVLSSAAVHFWCHSRKIITLDACHLYGKLQGCCMFATVKDANNCNITLGYSIIGNENMDNWCYFSNLVFDMFPGCQLVISDRDKGGLQAVVNYENPSCVLANCALHLMQNAKDSSAEGKSLVTMLALSADNKAYEYNLDRIRKRSEHTANELDKNRDLFCFPFLQKRGLFTNYGQTSSNSSEQQNAKYGDFRDMPFGEGMMHYLTDLSVTFCKRKQEATEMLNSGKLVVDSIVKEVHSKGVYACSKGWRYDITRFNADYSNVTFCVKNSMSGPAANRHQNLVEFYLDGGKWSERINCNCGLYIV